VQHKLRGARAIHTIRPATSLGGAGLDALFQGLISVDAVRAYTPAPSVSQYAAARR
jgi:hypothetical protein